MEYCNQCGKSVDSTANFCPSCGIKLDSSLCNNNIDKTFKVDLTNKTTEKLIDNIGSGISSSVTKLKGTANTTKSILWPTIKFIIGGATIFGVIGIIGVGVYDISESYKQRTAIKDARKYNKEWAVYGSADPASNKTIGRYASITSVDGKCEIYVEKRINGDELTGLSCIGIKIISYQDIYVKFDTLEEATKMKIKSYRDSDDVYIPSKQNRSSAGLMFDDGYMTYQDFIRGLITESAMAIYIPSEKGFWVKFVLKGSTEAINQLGKEI